MKRFIVYNSILIGILLVLQQLLSSSIGPNANEIAFSHKYTYNMFMPEGWGFFTRNARESQYLMYRIDYPQHKLEIITEKNSSFSSLGGLSRYSRRLNLEFRRLTSSIPDSCWIKKEGKMTQIKYDIQPYIISLSGFKDGILYIKRGDYIAVSFEPIPWAWSKYPDNFSTEYKLVKISLR